jgi:hypothetical protein
MTPMPCLANENFTHAVFGGTELQVLSKFHRSNLIPFTVVS